MKKLTDVAWGEVENILQKEEEIVWRSFYENKGFKNWKDWRWARFQMLGLCELDWQIEKPDNIIEEVRRMYCDATTRWTEFYKKREDSTFGKLKDHRFFADHQRVLDIRKNFPNGSQMIGLRNREKIIVIDGHHRGTAIAGMDERYPVPQVNFAISEIPDEHFEKLFNGGYLLKAERRVWDLMGLIRIKIKNIK